MALLVDLGPQRPVDSEPPGLTVGELSRDQALEILEGLADALGMDWDDFAELLAKAWAKRVREKCKGFGWFDD